KCSTSQPIRMLAVSAKEMSPPGNKEALNWMLLSTEGSADLPSAKMILNWYRLRWQIERFFYALKQGTRIKDRQLNEPDDLRKCVAFDAITAFRVWDLTRRWGEIAPTSEPFGIENENDKFDFGDEERIDYKLRRL
ncbi:MAG: transposase, partial [Gammaproteobacteria bacterium]|nr:transposase [Gammaproteobacteria bacterium]